MTSHITGSGMYINKYQVLYISTFCTLTTIASSGVARVVHLPLKPARCERLKFPWQLAKVNVAIRGTAV